MSLHFHWFLPAGIGLLRGGAGTALVGGKVPLTRPPYREILFLAERTG